MNSSDDLSKEKTESKNIFKNLKNDYFLLKLFDNLVFKEKGEINQMKSKNKYEKIKNDYFL